MTQYLGRYRVAAWTCLLMPKVCFGCDAGHAGSADAVEMKFDTRPVLLTVPRSGAQGEYLSTVKASGPTWSNLEAGETEAWMFSVFDWNRPPSRRQLKVFAELYPWLNLFDRLIEPSADRELRTATQEATRHVARLASEESGLRRLETILDVGDACGAESLPQVLARMAAAVVEDAETLPPDVEGVLMLIEDALTDPQRKQLFEQLRIRYGIDVTKPPPPPPPPPPRRDDSECPFLHELYEDRGYETRQNAAADLAQYLIQLLQTRSIHATLRNESRDAWQARAALGASSGEWLEAEPGGRWDERSYPPTRQGDRARLVLQRLRVPSPSDSDVELRLVYGPSYNPRSGRALKIQTSVELRYDLIRSDLRKSNGKPLHCLRIKAGYDGRHYANDTNTHAQATAFAQELRWFPVGRDHPW